MVEALRLAEIIRGMMEASITRRFCSPWTRSWSSTTAQLLPWIDPENFNPGYLMRGMHLLPKRGDKQEWQHSQDYWNERTEFAAIDFEDRAFVYE